MIAFNNLLEGTVTSVGFSMDELTTLFDLKYGAPQIVAELQSDVTDEQTIKDAIKFAHEAGTLAKNIISCLKGEK